MTASGSHVFGVTAFNKPSPSRGEGWVGVCAPVLPQTAREALKKDFRLSLRTLEERASTPIPDPSPLEGEGSFKGSLQ